MESNLLKFCPKCGSTEITIELEPGQHNLFCRCCQLYCEIIIFDEGNNQIP